MWAASRVMRDGQGHLAERSILDQVAQRLGNFLERKGSIQGGAQSRRRRCVGHTFKVRLSRGFSYPALRGIWASVRVVEVTPGAPAPSLLAISIEVQPSSLELRLGS